MKRLFVFSLVAVLSVGLLSVGAFAQVNTTGEDEDSGSTTVYWSYSGVVPCEVSIDVHSDVNLGELEEVDSEYTSEQETVETTSNCSYELTAKSTGYDTPIGNLVYDDFQIRLEEWDSSSVDADNDLKNSWEYFANGGHHSSQPLTWTVGTWDENSDGSEETHDWDMKYRYDTDSADENGYYEVDLEYTLSTT